MKVWIDGQFYEKSEAKVSVFDHGLLYGDGVFEGIRSYAGVVFKLDEHIDRLYASSKAILLNIPLSKKEMSDAIVASVRENGLKDAYIRVIVTRGAGDLGLDMRKCPKPGIIIIADKIQLFPEEVYNRGLKLIVSHLRRVPPDTLSPAIKSLNYLNNILARAEASRANCEEAILLNRDGYVAECSGDNIFAIRNGKVHTPPVYVGILEGITRNTVMDLAAQKLGLQVAETVFTVPQMYRADEVFVTGTGAEIIGVVEVNGRIIADGKPGPLTMQLIKEFRRFACSPEAGTPVYQTASV
ncbi:MAG: branched-chain-amino-acid transaminase [Elusimicrobia bacterium CG1_02_63_36]|nr:MAG: branched-chain-amino-acid transaminase [Elusimicrobia bacterium CG1_02_63_36]PIP82674.1 MAG: branched-chain-amino-acid transaminase [Elusimicrobia bacterium CG22_combo_CG10-13_8_21_14_all_63_91]PJA14099.1 MAG: branched-chain-amino-acid transaminase [Elusimicrobia bacterium CG_4_10_14_0_2_um_filter_63_34]PJB27055.1 MAG: branched-chain-amino-acid transaminase [Elusimicrobia bacterium CG_4_9_14_3_um_filter_62_55]